MKIHIERASNINTLKITVKNNIVYVLAPESVESDYILRVVENNREWIKSRINMEYQDKETYIESDTTKQSIKLNEAHRETVDIYNFRLTYICGIAYRVKESQDGKTFCANQNIYINESKCKKNKTRAKEIKAILQKLAKQYLTQIISKFGSSISMCPTKIEIKSISGSSWLKCTNPTERQITIDFRVIQLPIELQKYIVIHAFSHFFQQGHTENFWNIVSNYLPDYAEYEKELQKFSYFKDIEY